MLKDKVNSKTFSEMIEGISLKEIIETRDSFEKTDYRWDIYNILHGVKLEDKYPTYTEQIKVVKSDILSDIEFNNGIYELNNNLFNCINRSIEHQRRSLVEYNDEYLQLIACAIIKQGDRFLFMTNKKERSSLHGTTGFIGGHLNNDDLNPESGLMREIQEETNISSESIISCEPLFLIHDRDHLEISKRHLGIVYAIEIDDNYQVMTKKEEQGCVTALTKSELTDIFKFLVKPTVTLDSWVLLSEYYLGLYYIKKK